jgi:hypothetical protein
VVALVLAAHRLVARPSMSKTNDTERTRELTEAELDAVSGGLESDSARPALNDTSNLSHDTLGDHLRSRIASWMR